MAPLEQYTFAGGIVSVASTGVVICAVQGKTLIRAARVPVLLRIPGLTIMAVPYQQKGVT